MKRQLITFLLLATFSMDIYAQDFCETPAITNTENVKLLSNLSKRTASTNYNLKVYFHVIRTSSGNGGVSYSNVQSAFNRLNNDFNSHGIYFYWGGHIDYIDNSTFYNNPDTCIFHVNNHIDGIDIYLYPDDVNQSSGKAYGVGVGSELYLIGSWNGTPLCTTRVISHEMGHVLNLWHTHHGTYYLESGCPELVNGSNSSSCGDYVEDTPADPCLTGKVIDCVYVGNERDANNQLYTPNVQLIMSYTPPSCMSYFTIKQVERMRDAIENLPHLTNTLYMYMSGPSTICSSSTGTYTINYLPSDYTVNWYFTNGNGQVAPSIQSSGNTCTIMNNLSNTYVGYLNASIYHNGILLRTLQTDVIFYAGFYGEYSCGSITNQPFYPLSPIWVGKGMPICLKSINMLYKNVTYSVTTPSTWQYYPFNGELYLTYPNINSNNPIYITIQSDPNHPSCDNTTYQIVIMPNDVLPHPLLRTFVDENGRIVVSLVEKECRNVLKSVHETYADIRTKPNTWILEVYRATTSHKVFSKVICGDSYMIDTMGWLSGIYIVKAIYGNETLSEKVRVR